MCKSVHGVVCYLFSKNSDNANLNAGYLANFGSNWSNTDNAGVFQLNVNMSATNTNTNNGAHMMLNSVLVRHCA